MDRQVNTENEINFDSLSDYLRERYEDREKCSDMRPRMLEDLIVNLHNYFNTIGQIEQALVRTQKAFRRFESENPSSNMVDHKYSAEGTVKLSMQLLYDDFNYPEKTALDEVDPDKLAEYKKLILPEEN